MRRRRHLSREGIFDVKKKISQKAAGLFAVIIVCLSAVGFLHIKMSLASLVWRVGMEWNMCKSKWRPVFPNYTSCCVVPFTFRILWIELFSAVYLRAVLCGPGTCSQTLGAEGHTGLNSPVRHSTDPSFEYRPREPVFLLYIIFLTTSDKYWRSHLKYPWSHPSVSIHS